jgi:hypothetical protein
MHPESQVNDGLCNFICSKGEHSRIAVQLNTEQCITPQVLKTVVVFGFAGARNNKECRLKTAPTLARYCDKFEFHRE